MTNYGDPPVTVLQHLYKRVCDLADPGRSVVNEAKAFRQYADRLEEQTLMSGAMRRDIEVVGIFSRAAGGFRIKPELR